MLSEFVLIFIFYSSCRALFISKMSKRGIIEQKLYKHPIT